MKIVERKLAGIVLIELQAFNDQRGFFLESFHDRRYREIGITGPFVQDNYSHSKKDVLRGLHFQRRHAQGKLISVVNGEVFDVAVDIRRGSPTFGQWYGTYLNAGNHRQLYIPPGFAHGFCVLSDSVDLLYKCTAYYHPEEEIGVMWNDPDIGIDWPIVNPDLSAKDSNNCRLHGLDASQLPAYLGNE